MEDIKKIKFNDLTFSVKDRNFSCLEIGIFNLITKNLVIEPESNINNVISIKLIHIFNIINIFDEPIDEEDEKNFIEYIKHTVNCMNRIIEVNKINGNTYQVPVFNLVNFNEEEVEFKINEKVMQLFIQAKIKGEVNFFKKIFDYPENFFDYFNAKLLITSS